MEKVVDILKKALKDSGITLEEEEIKSLIEVPPSIDFGDYAFPCFSFAEQLKMSPHEIALRVREKIGNVSELEFDDVQVKGAYVNFFLDRKNLARELVWNAIQKKTAFGSSRIGKGKKVIVEFSSPNIAKPFGVGHLRSTIIGNSLANIAEFLGYKVRRINYLGDWGSQFGKLIAIFEETGNEERLMKNPIKYLLNLYVKANKFKKYEKLGREAFKRLESGNKKELMLWRLFRNLSISEFEKIYDTFKIKFDEYAGESSSVKLTQRIIDELKEKNLLKRSKGAKIVDLRKHNLGVALIQKTDGTTLYATRDIAEAVRRKEKYDFDIMIYEVGQEQELYFKQIFKILELMGYEWADRCIHISHGLYLDKNQKRLSTRKGRTFLIEKILEKTKKLAEKEIKKRWPKLKKNELEKRALTVAIASIFYGDLKNNRKNNIVFDLKKFTSFEGDTGPYILYSYARAGSILKKADSKKIISQFRIHDLDEKELELVKKLREFPEIVVKAFDSMSPSLIANFCYQSCQKFNEFYHSCPVIKSDKTSFRLALVESFRQILRNALHLLGIEILEEM